MFILFVIDCVVLFSENKYDDDDDVQITVFRVGEATQDIDLAILAALLKSTCVYSPFCHHHCHCSLCKTASFVSLDKQCRCIDQFSAVVVKRLAGTTTTTILHSFNGLFSRTTCISQHQKSRTILVKPIWIYWSRDWLERASKWPIFVELEIKPEPSQQDQSDLSDDIQFSSILAFITRA